MSRLLPILLIVVSIALFFGYIDGQYKAYGQLKIDKEAHESALATAQQLKGRHNDLKSKKAEFTAEELTSLEKLLPDSIDSVQMILDLNSVARTHGMLVKEIDINDAPQNVAIGQDVSGEGRPRRPVLGQNAAGFTRYSVNFTVESDYFSFTDFIADLERSLRLLDIYDISISPGLITNYAFELTAHTYSLK